MSGSPEKSQTRREPDPPNETVPVCLYTPLAPWGHMVTPRHGAPVRTGGGGLQNLGAALVSVEPPHETVILMHRVRALGLGLWLGHSRHLRAHLTTCAAGPGVPVPTLLDGASEGVERSRP